MEGAAAGAGQLHQMNEPHRVPQTRPQDALSVVVHAANIGVYRASVRERPRDAPGNEETRAVLEFDLETFGVRDDDGVRCSAKRSRHPSEYRAVLVGGKLLPPRRPGCISRCPMHRSVKAEIVR